jgi:hypothetical protein
LHNAISKSFADETDALADTAASARLQQLQEAEDRLTKEEGKIKKQVHEEDKNLRQQSASASSVQKRNNIVGRANRNAAETQAIINGLHRASGGP